MLYNDTTIFVNTAGNNLFYTGVGWTPSITFSMPVIVGEGQIVSGGGHINGYLVGGDYFADFSGSGGSGITTSNSSGSLTALILFFISSVI